MSIIAPIIGCCFFTFSWATIVTQINYVKFLIDSYNRLLRSFLLNNEIALPKAYLLKICYSVLYSYRIEISLHVLK